MYIVHSQGHYNCPEFGTIEAARECLREIVREEVEACRRRFKAAYKHVIGPDYYEITLASDRRSTRWSMHWIAKY